MKREELIELNVPEEAIDKIMQINGADIEKAKSALEEKEKALTEAHENLEAANKQIEEFKGMDIESIQKACDDWKQKAEQAEADKQKFIHESKVAGYVKGLKLKDDIYENHVTKMLGARGLTDLIKVTPLAKIDTTLQGRAGDTVTLPKFAYIGDAADVAEGEAIPLALLTTST